jgi:hypothetical protein
MGLFGNLFARKPPTVDADTAIWKSGAQFLGAVLLIQFFAEDRPFSDDELQGLLKGVNPTLRKSTELWTTFYVTWLFLLLAKAKYGEKFGRDVMSEVYGRIATNEDRLPGIDAIADGIKYWFRELDEGAQDAFKNPTVIGGITLPLDYLFALLFLARDGSSPFSGVSNPEFNDIDMHIADVLEQAKEISRPRIDGFIEKAASLPR